jgi:hypothetical protein
MKPVRSLMLSMAVLSATALAQTAPREAHKLFPDRAAAGLGHVPTRRRAAGSFPAVMESRSGTGGRIPSTDRPTWPRLGLDKLPIVAFANGGCVNIGNRFRYFCQRDRLARLPRDRRSDRWRRRRWNRRRPVPSYARRAGARFAGRRW